MTRSFIALPLPDALIAPLVVLQHMLPLRRRVPPENFHVTLAFLGDLGAEQLDELNDRLLTIRAAPVALSLGAPGMFGGDRPRLTFASVTDTPELTALQAQVTGAVRRAGLRLEARRFVPHVTLSRERPQGVDLMRLEHALGEASGFSAGPETVRDVRLMESHLGKDGPEYTPVALYPLRGGAGSRAGGGLSAPRLPAAGPPEDI